MCGVRVDASQERAPRLRRARVRHRQKADRFRCDGAGEHRQASHPLLPHTLARVGIAGQDDDVHSRRQLTQPARLDLAARRDLLKPWKGQAARLRRAPLTIGRFLTEAIELMAPCVALATFTATRAA